MYIMTENGWKSLGGVVEKDGCRSKETRDTREKKTRDTREKLRQAHLRCHGRNISPIARRPSGIESAPLGERKRFNEFYNYGP